MNLLSIIDDLKNAEPGSNDFADALWKVEDLIKLAYAAEKLDDYLKIRYNISYASDWGAPELRNFSKIISELNN